jgi:pyruvate,water dikinase
MAKKQDERYIYWFKELGIKDVPIVGGKNASLGEMVAKLGGKGVRVPDGFAISAHAYNYYINKTGIRSEIEKLIRGLKPNDLASLAHTGESIRMLIKGTRLPTDLEQAIQDSYDEMCKMYGGGQTDTAVRSSATAEDLPDASFAGQQDTYLNVRGHENLLECCRACFASLFTDRAISYRDEKKFDHFSVALSIAVQKMVRSDLASAGVMFSIDTESGFKDAVYVTGSYGLGESVVQGSVNPDEFYVHKPTLKQGFKPVIYAHLGEKQTKIIYTDPGRGKGVKKVDVPPEERAKFCLTDEEVVTLAKWAQIIEDHYSEEAGYFKPMDMEWAKDGQTGQLFIVQARPETVISRREAGVIRRMVLEKTSKILAEGMAVGDKIGVGAAHVIKSAEQIAQFKPGSILVTEMTDPDWVPIMKAAAAIVTDQGGRTCHAAIISRELGIPCIVGTGNGSNAVKNGQEITVSCAGGSKGQVYEGKLPFHQEEMRLDQLAMPKIGFWFHQSNPDRAFPDAVYPGKGVGLLRMDEVIRDEVKIHPLAAIHFDEWKSGGENPADVKKMEDVSLGYPDKKEFFVTRLSQGIGRIAASVFPRPVHVLLTDAPSRELDALLGGKSFSFEESNPILGARGAARYTDLDYEEAVGLEIEALKRARDTMGMANLSLVFPAVASEKELKALLAILNQQGLKRGQGGMEYHLLCRTPAQVLSLEDLAGAFDGFLFDVSDLAQLALGMDGRNVRVRSFYQDDHPAVMSLLEMGVEKARKLKKQVGLVNMAPAKLRSYAGNATLRKANYIVIRPDIFDAAREAFLEGEGKKA